MDPSNVFGKQTSSPKPQSCSKIKNEATSKGPEMGGVDYLLDFTFAK